jgi:hypothetical protein
MRLLTTLLGVFGVFAVGGCAQVTDPQGEPVQMTITSWPEPAVPLEGVRLCETDTPNCATTDADGKAMLWLPEGETSFTKERKGFGSYLVPLIVPAGGLAHDSGMGTDAFLDILYEDVMSPYPMGDMGRISTAAEPGFEGTTFDLFDADGPIAEPKRYYVDAGPTWNTDLSATTTVGGGGFLEVSPGEYSVQFGGTAINCIADPSGWPGLFLPNSIRLRVRAGYITQALATCSRAP